ncbi:hypothetical protein ES705_11378 [subsurface metagenome]
MVLNEFKQNRMKKSPLKIALEFFGTVFLFALILVLIDFSEAKEGAETGF